MNIAAVFYTYDLSRSEELAEIRPTHREFLKSLFVADKLLASGPLDTDQALIVVRAESPEAALELLAPDPLNEAGIIIGKRAQMWNPVIGPFN